MKKRRRAKIKKAGYVELGEWPGERERAEARRMKTRSSGSDGTDAVWYGM